MYVGVYTSADKLEGSLAELLAGKGFGYGSKSLHLLPLLLLLRRLLYFAIASHLSLPLLSFWRQGFFTLSQKSRTNPPSAH